MSVLAIAAGAALLGALYILIFYLKWKLSRRGASKDERRLEVILMNMVLGSQKHFDRLVAEEERKVLGKPRSWYLERAIERLKKDRR